jgi:hypothetical protein
MNAVIGFVLSEFGFEFFVLGLLAAAVAIARHPPPRGRTIIGEHLLTYYVLFPIGCLYLVNFVYHVFFGAMSAHFIGWADSPFQTELGFASLGFALVGLLAWRGGYELRLAAVAGPAMFLLGAAGGHIYQMIAHSNYAAGNSGLLLWMDVVIPLAGFFFLALARPAKSPQRQAVDNRKTDNLSEAHLRRYDVVAGSGANRPSDTTRSTAQRGVEESS